MSGYHRIKSRMEKAFGAIIVTNCQEKRLVYAINVQET